MSDLLAHLDTVRDAFERPTLRLLNRDTAKVTVALLRAAFPRNVRAVETGRMHTLMDTWLQDLRAAGVDSVPRGTGREVCLKWHKRDWLNRDLDDLGDGEVEVYTLSSDSQEALRLVDSMTRGKAVLSEHRISTIINVARDWNSEVNPDRERRMNMLRQQAARATAEADRLQAGAPMLEITGDRMLEGFANFLDLISGLPGEFSRLDETMTAMRRQIVAEYRADPRPRGQIVDSYLDRSAELLSATPEGRAFAGAIDLLRNEPLIYELRENLQELVAHPTSESILTTADRRDILAVLDIIERGTEIITAQRRRLTATLRAQVVHRDTATTKKIDETLRALEVALGARMGESRGKPVKVPVAILPERLEPLSVKNRYYDPDEGLPPEPLAPAVIDLEDPEIALLRMRGLAGPDAKGLASHVARMFVVKDEDVDRPTSLAELFCSLPDTLRRPVDVLGLHLLARSAGVDPVRGHDELFEALRPDGTTVFYRAPRIEPTLPQAIAMAEIGGADLTDDRDLAVPGANPGATR